MFSTHDVNFPPGPLGLVLGCPKAAKQNFFFLDDSQRLLDLVSFNPRHVLTRECVCLCARLASEKLNPSNEKIASD